MTRATILLLALVVGLFSGSMVASAQSRFDPLAGLGSSEGRNTQEEATYRVKPGDTLYGIALRFYGDGYRWNEIFQANRDQIDNPDLIFPDQVFRIPRGPKVEIPVKGTYVVQAGDTLSSLSQRFFGTPDRWQEIYAANADRILDAAALSAGTELRIPEGAAGPAKPEPSTPVTAPPRLSAGQGGELESVARQGGFTTRSPQFAQWASEALQIAERWDFPALPNRYGQVVSRADFLRAILFIESHGIHSRSGGRITESSAGALGFMQLMPATARGLGVDPRDPRENLLGGAKFLGECLRGPNTGNPNDGPIDRLIKGACGYNRGPYADELRDKSWDQYVRTSHVSENVQYGILTKMCLGYELSGAEKDWLMRHRGLSAGGVEDMAEQYFRGSHALF